jgi:hypothetical protein
MKKQYDFCQHCEDFNDDCYEGKREDCPYQEEIDEQNKIAESRRRKIPDKKEEI